MNLEDTIDGLSYKFHMVIGTAIGFLTSVITNNVDEIFLTFMLGVAGALGASFVKLMVDLVKKSNKRGKGKHDKD